MSLQQINDLNLTMQNVIPAQVYVPGEPQPPSPDEELKPEIESTRRSELRNELPDELPAESSSRSCSCVDTYA